ncbi:MAG: hypothetical protein ACJA14_000381 [Ilumatobacter sp.]|jgi:hypothetical protein
MLHSHDPKPLETLAAADIIASCVTGSCSFRVGKELDDECEIGHEE